MKLKCLSGKHGDGSGWYENEPLGFKVERELHFFNLAVARHHRIELYSTDSPALPFKTQMLRASTANLLRVCGGKTEHMSSPVAGGLPKTPQTANIHLPAVRLQGLSVNTSDSNPHVRSLLHSSPSVQWGFPKRQTSFVISSSFFFLCVRNSKLSSKMASQGWKNVTWL